MHEGNFSCFRCKHRFRDHNDLQRHYDRKNRCKAVDEAQENAEWHCDCCEKPFSTKSNYTAHLKTKSHERIASERATRAECDSERRSNTINPTETAGPSNLADEIVKDSEVTTVGPSVQSEPNALDRKSSSDFLTFLRAKFDDEEAHAFFTSFALTLQGKNDDFCIDLDEAYKWLGYSLKQKAVDLLKKLKLEEKQDFLLTRSGEQKLPDKYLFKPAAFKKLLLAARTKAAKKAAEYFIKIEEAIPEFYRKGGTYFASSRIADWKTLPISAYTAKLSPKGPEDQIVSAGYNEDFSDPKAYLIRSGGCLYPPGLIPEGATVLDFGQTSDSKKRIDDYVRKTGMAEYLEHYPVPDPLRLERAIRRIAVIEGRLVYGRRPDGSRTCEQIYVTDQADHNSFAAKIYNEQQKIIVEHCKLQGEREKRLTAEVELAKEREKTKQIVAQGDANARVAEAEARKVEAEVRCKAEIRKLQIQCPS